MQRRHAPLFELDEHNNYRAIPFSDPIYLQPTPHHSHSHSHSHSEQLTAAAAPSGFQLFLSDLQQLSWRSVADWVLKPFISGLAFGMGSYGSRYIVHALMVRYSDYHVPPDMGGSAQQPTQPPGGAAGEAAAAAVEGTSSVVAEAVAHQLGEQAAGGSQSLAVTASHHHGS